MHMSSLKLKTKKKLKKENTNSMTVFISVYLTQQ